MSLKQPLEMFLHTKKLYQMIVEILIKNIMSQENSIICLSFLEDVLQMCGHTVLRELAPVATLFHARCGAQQRFKSQLAGNVHQKPGIQERA